MTTYSKSAHKSLSFLFFLSFASYGLRLPCPNFTFAPVLWSQILLTIPTSYHSKRLTPLFKWWICLKPAPMESLQPSLSWSLMRLFLLLSFIVRNAQLAKVPWPRIRKFLILVFFLKKLIYGRVDISKN